MKFDFGKNEDAKNDFNSFKEQSNEEKQANIQKIKEAKQASKNKHEGANYVTITFDNFDNKAYFMERFGFDHYDLYIKGELFEKRIERIETPQEFNAFEEMFRTDCFRNNWRLNEIMPVRAKLKEKLAEIQKSL